VRRGERWYDVQLVPVPGAAGRSPSVAGVVNDVTDRQRVEADRQRVTAELVVRTAHESALADLAQRALEIADEQTLWDAGARTLTRQLSADLVTIRPNDGAAAPSPRPDGDVTTTCVPVGPPSRPVATVAVRRQARPLTPNDHEFIRSVAAVLGAAALRIRVEDAVRYRSLHDPLTGLPNRAALLDRLRRSLRRADRAGRRAGVLFIDLDDFKAVNDTLGHQAGDELLRIVASRLSEAVRPGDVVGRLGGDEFAVLCDDIRDLDQLRGIAERVLATALTPPIELGRLVSVSGSVGLALSGPDVADAEELLNAADMAMYEAKQSGPSRVAAYDDRIRAALATRLHDVSDLRHAVAADELTLRFAPIMSRSGVVVAAEAVPCWGHPTRGLLGPDDLHPIAFDAGLIVDVDRWLVDRVVSSLAALSTTSPERASSARARPAGPEHGPRQELWLRISGRGLSDAAIRRTILSRDWRARGGQNVALCLLVPETVANRDPRALDAIIGELMGAGVAVRVDFTENGPIRAVTRETLPSGLSGIRLGGPNIHSAEHSGVGVAIVAGIVQFAHLLNLDVAARGVDTPGALAAIRDLGCDLAQGTAVGEPLPTPPW
jgi:diguanylate cyclase (GGDEF)-like protein